MEAFTGGEGTLREEIAGPLPPHNQSSLLFSVLEMISFEEKDLLLKRKV